ncbi:MAG: hypothetical protein ABI165_11500 [Bryobacteraceae bacterium]
MTKIQLHYPLLRRLADSDLESVARITGVYGLWHVRVAPALDAVTVDYDATRMSPKDVENVLNRFGIPIARKLV